MKILKQIFLTGFCVLLISSALSAQETLSAEKKQLIGEIIVLTKADRQMTDMMNLMMISFENSFQDSIKSTIGKTEMSAAQKDELEKRLISDQSRFISRFRERFQKEISPQQYLEETMYPLYGKFFSVAELTDLVGFYKSPTGKKLIEQLPQLMAESFKVSQEKFVPRLRKITEEIIEEQMKTYSSDPPPPAKPLKK